MRASIVTRLDKLSRRLPPTWDDLWRVALAASEKMNQAELDAYLAFNKYGNGTAEQSALWDEWLERNEPRIWAAWDDRFPGWAGAPFWKSEATDGDGGDDWE